MPQASFEHKKGDTFDYTLQIPLSFPDNYFTSTEWSKDAKIKDAAGADVAIVDAGDPDDIVLTFDATFRNLNVLVKDTSGWTPGAGFKFDVQFKRDVVGGTADDYVVSTDTFYFDVIADVT